MVLPAAGQCRVQSDWGTYTVVRGDTLFKIARRFSTTTSALVQANCLANANRINVGQQLFVPSGGTSPAATPTVSGIPEHPVWSYYVGATYQQFEHGFMTWQGSGVIWAFFDNGRVVSYPLHVYGGLSDGARYVGPPLPAGLGMPTNGFKRVWSNFKETHDLLGWAVGGEKGYQMSLIASSFGRSYFDMSLPDGKLIRIFSDGTWGNATGVVPTPQVTSTPAPSQRAVGATFQPFDNGFMVWRADTGEIRVYVGGDSGDLTTHPLSQYASLTIQQSFPAPANHWAPEFGFGKVWSGIAGVKDKIGWALTGERGYTMILHSFDSAGNLTSFSLPDGRFLTYKSGSTWVITANGVLVNS
jgi:murein DD-endopeptidase MepM/ murein hydrolase activator NlpD